MFAKFAEWHRRYERNKIARLSKDTADLLRKNSILNELVESLTADLELLEEMCGQAIVADAENVLKDWAYEGNTIEGVAEAGQKLSEAIRQILFVSDEYKQEALQEAGFTLGRYCADNYLCPLATSLALYRTAMIDSQITPEEATAAIVLSMRASITGRLRERGV